MIYYDFAQSYKNLSYLQKKKENFSSFIKEKQYLCTLINQKYDMPQSLHIAIIWGCRRILCGEVLDIDAITGGFNLQAAWTTGYVVGQHIGE